jgi:hypothetical protein
VSPSLSSKISILAFFEISFLASQPPSQLHSFRNIFMPPK